MLFMGASRSVGLLERFVEAATELGIAIEMFSLEDDSPWHAIEVAGLAAVIPAPPFRANHFSSWLFEFVRDERIDIIVPAIDIATVSLARAAAGLLEIGALPVVSSVDVCEAMADKARADKVYRSLGLRVPDGTQFPLLAKPRFGASSRGIVRISDAAELSFWKTCNREEDYVIQPLIEGTEFSLDAFVDSRRHILGIVSRERIVVSDGEVMVTRTKHQDEAINMVERLVAWDRWFGPLTVQVMDDGRRVWILECNPRFGSGVTCSIEAGLAAPEWILRERLGLPLPNEPASWRDGLCLTRSRKDHFRWLS